MREREWYTGVVERYGRVRGTKGKWRVADNGKRWREKWEVNVNETNSDGEERGSKCENEGRKKTEKVRAYRRRLEKKVEKEEDKIEREKENLKIRFVCRERERRGSRSNRHHHPGHAPHPS